ncbi:HK97-gp10 family putative phage morphogenesis protein [Acetanaerobacterium elongatum]|uniref:Phage protein, HK97 gp10 family n=1 Tax=Acetanaerobacterium elongatum TaxID=258515 RepID=A0A1H0E8U3_9FIRM|nr:HK97-gp10 family putative phage morphogenesis protein [Acetanaerobacterium elongatum]SDN78749.1 phage protein, HK97 gp10 family [Acetanaerobacterium elongatum]
MAKVDFKMPEDFLLKLSRLGEKTDEILPKVLESGAEVVYSKVKANLSSVIGSGKGISRSTGELESALGVSPVLQDKYGDFNVKIGFVEPRSDGESNAKIANIIEYGKSNQPPRPFLKPAKTACKNACIEAMKAKLESEMNSL